MQTNWAVLCSFPDLDIFVVTTILFECLLGLIRLHDRYTDSTFKCPCSRGLGLISLFWTINKPSRSSRLTNKENCQREEQDMDPRKCFPVVLLLKNYWLLFVRCYQLLRAVRWSPSFLYNPSRVSRVYIDFPT